jgi:DNA-directed RNA polymerase specialized sigma24 family protein
MSYSEVVARTQRALRFFLRRTPEVSTRPIRLECWVPRSDVDDNLRKWFRLTPPAPILWTRQPPGAITAGVLVRGGMAMSSEERAGSISLCLSMLKKGDRGGAQRLWETYFHRLVALARSRLGALAGFASDEEDVALSAFKSLLLRAERGQFPRLEDRDDLWQLLYVITVRKAVDLVKRERARFRGGGAVSRLTDLDEHRFDFILSSEPTPELAAQVAEQCRLLLDALGDETLRRVALWKMEGHTNKEVAEKLGVVEQTVERKLRRIREIWIEGGMV